MGTGTLRSVPGAAAGWVRQGLGLLFFFLSSIDAGWDSGPEWEAAPLRCEGQSHPFARQPLRISKEGPLSNYPLTSVRVSVPSSVQYGQSPMPAATAGVTDPYLKDLQRPAQVPTPSPMLPERAAPHSILLRLLEFPAPVAEGAGLAEEMWREGQWM